MLAPGSLNGLITGKHFNRCKRIHHILALAFEILHFQAFLETLDGNEELAALLCSFERAPDDERTPDADTWQAVESSEIFTLCVTKYKEYTHETRTGTHGVTAQFWIPSVDYIHDFHNLERAIRTNDTDLFTHALTPVIQLLRNKPYQLFPLVVQIPVGSGKHRQNTPWLLQSSTEWCLHRQENRQVLQQMSSGSNVGADGERRHSF